MHLARQATTARTRGTYLSSDAVLTGSRPAQPRQSALRGPGVQKWLTAKFAGT